MGDETTSGRWPKKYLYVMPQVDVGAAPKWHVFLLGAESPRIAPAGRATSLADARKLADEVAVPLFVAQEAWRQMVKLDVAPNEPPEAVTVV